LLPPGQDPRGWSGLDYLLTIDQLIALHDRFWKLGDDLAIYTWLARPLDLDFEIYVKAAAKGVEKLVRATRSPLLKVDPGLPKLLGQIVIHADKIAAALQKDPSTLIHGDYWPGNIHLDSDKMLTVYDWQQTGIGSGIQDLVTFVQASRWWFDPLPISSEEIIQHYRDGLETATGHAWTETEWEAQWDYALLWTFLAHWVDLIAEIPDSLMETRHKQFEQVWLGPLRRATGRRLPAL
jgi:hypothetical protein